MCAQVVPAAQNEDVPVPVVVCCAQAGSVGKQSVGKRGRSSTVMLLEVVQKDATGGLLLVLAKNLQHFSAMFYDSSAASSQNEEWPKNQGSYGNFKAQGSA